MAQNSLEAILKGQSFERGLFSVRQYDPRIQSDRHHAHLQLSGELHESEWSENFVTIHKQVECNVDRGH